MLIILIENSGVSERGVELERRTSSRSEVRVAGFIGHRDQSIGGSLQGAIAGSVRP
jgi:hypothetical protein